VAATDDVILVDPTAGNITVNLPTAVNPNAGKRFTIERMTGGANTVTIDPAGAETIDGASTLALASQWD
jgi:hypothetical protein